MGRKARSKPARLAEKLLKIRKALGLSQNDLIYRLGLRDELTQASISQYEAGVREPTLMELLKYARLVNVYVDVLIDDEINPPQLMPSRRKSMGTGKPRGWLRPVVLSRKK